MAPRIRAVVLALPSVVTFDLGVAVQIFGGVSDRLPGPGGYDVEVCTLAPGAVPTPNGLAVEVEHGLERLGHADLVIVPGHDDFATPPPEPVRRALRDAYARGARVASICVGAFVLGFAGLLDGRRAATHWAAAPLLAEHFPRCEVDPGALFVDEGSVLTSAGLAAGIDLSLHVVRTDFGAGAASSLARCNVVAPHRAGGQAQFIPVPATAEPAGLADTLQWALANLEERLDVDAIARHAHVSPRTLARRFEAELGTTPKRWLQAQRVARARELLETTTLPIQDVARRTGFGSTAALRTHLRRQTARTPSEYRTTFAGP